MWITLNVCFAIVPLFISLSNDFKIVTIVLEDNI